MSGYKFSLSDLVCLVGSLGPGVLEASVYEKLFLSRTLSFKLLKSGGGVKWGGIRGCHGVWHRVALNL